MINYDDRRFRGSESGPNGTVPTATYHQNGDLVWAESSGGRVRRCCLTGLCDATGRLTIGYTMLLDDGQIAVGRCTSTPERLEDGRIRLREDWERYRPTPSSGVSYIEEVPVQNSRPAEQEVR